MKKFFEDIYLWLHAKYTKKTLHIAGGVIASVVFFLLFYIPSVLFSSESGDLIWAAFISFIGSTTLWWAWEWLIDPYWHSNVLPSATDFINSVKGAVWGSVTAGFITWLISLL